MHDFHPTAKCWEQSLLDAAWQTPGWQLCNQLSHVRPWQQNDYDGWEAMGNKGWGWDGLAPYFLKHQTLDKTRVYEDPQFMPIAGGGKFHGTNGPIHTSFNEWYMPLEVDFAKAAYDVTGRKKTISDAWSGDHLEFYSSLGVVKSYR